MIPIIVLPHYKGKLPEFATEHSAGVDIRAAIEKDILLKPNQDEIIPTGLKMHIGASSAHNFITAQNFKIGMYGMIVPRSGLGFKHYLRLANTAGIIDADYQGEIMIKIRNEGTSDLVIESGMRICQMVFHLYVGNLSFNQVQSFDAETERGEGGFGHSGTK